MNHGCLKLVLILVASSMRDLLSDANSVFSVNEMFQVGRLLCFPIIVLYHTFEHFLILVFYKMSFLTYLLLHTYIRGTG